MKELSFDIVIFGGGVAGLWLLNILKDNGYNAILLEKDSLGGEQTIKSQGIIHGGLKYSLNGIFNKNTESLEDIPNVWNKCFKGEGELDLSKVKILSKDQKLFSTGNLTSTITNFFAKMALKSQVKELNKSEYPQIFKNDLFKGKIYSLAETVIDVPSLIHELSHKYSDCIFKIGDYNFTKDTQKSLIINDINNDSIKINSQKYIFTAGQGNQELINKSSANVGMQLRPLQMVLMKNKANVPLYGHCMDNATTRLTITSHLNKEGEYIWYMGGEIAEKGFNKDESTLINDAKHELTQIFPWLDFSLSKFGTCKVNRAELQTSTRKKPESFSIESKDNIIVAWPTKLALAPKLATKILELLKKENILPTFKNLNMQNIDLNLQQPKIAKPLWDTTEYA